jgi:hypothetical protein
MDPYGWNMVVDIHFENKGPETSKGYKFLSITFFFRKLIVVGNLSVSRRIWCPF